MSALLDWLRAMAEARFLLVYRFPWEVAASMQRVGAEVFLRNPGWGAAIWTTASATGWATCRMPPRA